MERHVGMDLEELLFQCLERMETRGEAGLEELCVRHPELADELRQRVRDLRASGLVASVLDPRAEFPERLGEFRLLERLGAGGMGVVFLAEQESIGRRVALKLVRPEHLYFPGARERFQREVLAVGRLSHPCIVSVHAVGEESGLPYFAMEYVEGVSLETLLIALQTRTPDRLSGRALRDALERNLPDDAGAIDEHARVFSGTWSEACLWIVREVARALEHAHRRGVVHRDVKPSNVMLTNEGRVVLLDFGLAGLAGTDRLTRTGHQLGSLPYMPPELLEGGAPDERSDVYSLGVLLYEMTTFAPPFGGDTISRLQDAIRRGEPRAPRQRNPSLSWEIETVTLAAMEVSRERRYARAEDFARDLSHVLDGAPIEAKRPGVLLRAARLVRRKPTASLAIAFAVAVPLAFSVRENQVNASLREKNEAIGLEQAQTDEQRSLAVSNLGRAIEAVDLFLAKFSQARLENVPHMLPMRRELLEQALEFYEELSSQAGDDPEFLYARGRARVGAASVHATFGDDVRALERFAGSVEDLRAVIASEPGHVLARWNLAAALSQRAAVLARVDRVAELPAARSEALDLLAALVDEQPTNPGILADYLVARRNVAAGLVDRGEFAAAEAHYALLAERIAAIESDPGAAARVLASAAGAVGSEAVCRDQRMGQTGSALRLYPRAVRLFRRSLELWPEHAETRERFCQVLSAYGSTLCHAGRIDEGEPLIEEALAAAERLAEEFPSNFGFGRVRGSCLAVLATGRAIAGDAASARELFEEAILELDTAAEVLGDWTVVRDTASAYNNAASLELNLGNPEAAERLARRAFGSLDLLRRRSPGRAALEPVVQTISLTYAEAQLQLGRPDAAMAAVAELDGHPETAALAFARGELKARSAHLYKTAAAAPGEGRQDALGRSEALRSEACAHFRRALELGFDDYEYLRSEPDLDSIRDHPEFAALLAGLEER